MALNTLSTRIRILRDEKNFSQEKLGNLVGVSMHTVFRWEKGERVPNAIELTQLARALDVTIGYLMGETDDSRPLAHLQSETRDSQGSESSSVIGFKSREEESRDQTEGVGNFPHAEGTIVPPSRSDTDKRLFKVSNREKTVEAEIGINDPPEFIDHVLDRMDRMVSGDDSAKTSSGVAFKSVVGGYTSN